MIEATDFARAVERVQAIINDGEAGYDPLDDRDLNALRHVLRVACTHPAPAPEAGREAKALACVQNARALLAESGDTTAAGDWLAVAEEALAPARPAPAPDDAAAPIDDLVDRFAAALREKLHASEAKHGWRNAWRRDGWADDLRRRLREHVEKGDPRDVAAYCAFAWHHGWSLVLAPDGADTGGMEDEVEVVCRACGAHMAGAVAGARVRWVTCLPCAADADALAAARAREGALERDVAQRGRDAAYLRHIADRVDANEDTLLDSDTGATLREIADRLRPAPDDAAALVEHGYERFGGVWVRRDAEGQMPALDGTDAQALATALAAAQAREEALVGEVNRLHAILDTVPAHIWPNGEDPRYAPDD